MASHTKKDDFCLECHWGSFNLGEKEPEGPQEAQPSSQWDCPEGEHHSPLENCHVDDACCDEDNCDEDNCSITCPSVCDGFAECDESTACSVVHCNDDNCDDNCDTTEPVCFQDHCFSHSDTHADGADHSLESLLGLGGPLALDSSNLLPPAAVDHSQGDDSLSKVAANQAPEFVGTSPSAPFINNPYSTAVPHYHTHNSHHFHCHDFPKEMHNSLVQPSYPLQNDVNPAEVFHMLGMCPDLSACQNFHVHEEPNCHDHSNRVNGDLSSDSFTCFHIPHQNANHLMKSPSQLGARPSGRGPCRSHHRCRTHAHAHIHPYGHYSPYSRQSRSSISSQLMSSPGETPPPLDGGASSVLTSPEFTATDSDLHICKWTTTLHGVKTTCGATYSDPCTLQEHLISQHMATVDGAKGTGYYCCWEGCHRPDEPFSQKSKLQGHFLTHSNYKNFKCTVCGKFFARQATLERHERSHRGEKPYSCPDCGKSFTDSSELKTHSRTHTGEKPFKCTYPGCNFQTGDSSNMSSHRLTHGVRRHKCIFPGCTKSFTRPDQLKRHMRSTHKQDSSTFPSPIAAQLEQFELAFGSVA